MSLDNILLIPGLGEWTPASLFKPGDVGIWHDPSNFSTLRQLSDGTVSVTSQGDPIGFAADLSEGGLNKLGPELVVNGGFSTTDNWTLAEGSGGTAVISGGLLTLAGPNTSFPSATQSGILTANRWYRVTVNTTSNITPGSLGIRIGGISTQYTGFSTAGVYNLTIFSDGSDLRLIRNSGYVDTPIIDNVSVQEIPGHPTRQTTNGKRPILSRSPEGGVRQLLTNTDILSTQTVQVPNAQHTLSFRGAGTITLSGVSTAGPLVGTGVNDIVTLTFTPTAGNLTLTVIGTCEVGQLELGAARTAYQKSTTRYNITETGKRDCWAFGYDGIDDAMSTPSSVDMSGSDEMTVCVGVRKLSDASAGFAVEMSSSISSFDGTFYLLAPSSSGVSNYQFGSKGTILRGVSANSFGAPTSNVVTGLGNISGDTAIIRVDGAQIAVTPTDQGDGNYGNHRIYFGARNEVSTFFNGLIYQVVIINRLLNDYELAKLEQFVARKMGITL